MRQKSVPVREPATQVLKNIRRATRRHFSAEDKIRIVLEGLRGEDSYRRALPPRGDRPEPLFFYYNIYLQNTISSHFLHQFFFIYIIFSHNIFKF